MPPPSLPPVATSTGLRRSPALRALPVLVLACGAVSFGYRFVGSSRTGGGASTPAKALSVSKPLDAKPAAATPKHPPTKTRASEEPPKPSANPGACLAGRRTEPAPKEPNELLYVVSRSQGIDSNYPIANYSVWTPCFGGRLRKSHDLICLPPKYSHKSFVALRRPAFDSPVPGGLRQTHDGLSVGWKGRIGFRAMLEAAWQEAHQKLYVRSGYRSFAMQDQTFRTWVRTEMKLGLSKESATKKVAKYSAKPGHSEHQLGTTADLTYATPAGTVYAGWDPEVMSKSAPFRWALANAHRFGIVLSYPKGGQNRTGYNWEPWHYRYVGLPAADEMHRCGLTAEAYASRGEPARAKRMPARAKRSLAAGRRR